MSANHANGGGRETSTDADPNGAAPQRAPKSFLDAGGGLAADVAIGGLRYVSERDKEKREPKVNAEMLDVLDRLEAHRGLGLGLEPRPPAWDAERNHGYPPDPRSGQALYNAILDDILTVTSYEQDNLRRDEASEKAAVKHSDPSVVARWSMIDYRRRILATLLLLGVLWTVWEFSLKAVERRLTCQSWDGVDGLSSCSDAQLLVHAASGVVDCSEYRCAAPWSPGPNAEFCSSCGCGSVCDACGQCVCEIAGGSASRRNVCKPYDTYPNGEWPGNVRWALAGAFFLVLAFGLCKWTISTVTLSRQRAVAKERKKIESFYNIKQKDLERIRQDIVIARVDGDCWKQEEPYESFTRRMKVKLGDHDYERLVAGSTFPTAVSARSGHVQGSAHEAVRLLSDAKDDFVRDSVAQEHEMVSPTLAPDPPPHSSSAVSGTRRPSFSALDTEQLVQEAVDHFERVAAEQGTELLSRLQLYAALRPGDPPAVNLTTLHLTELASLLQLHHEPRAPVQKDAFAAEWVSVYKELCLMPLDAADATPRQKRPDAAKPLSNVLLGLLRGAGGIDDDDDATSESTDDDEDEALAGNAFVRALPALIALISGSPLPSKAKVKEQRAMIYAAIQYMHGLTGDTHDEDADAESVT